MVDFAEFAREFGLPWAIVIALAVALWSQMQYERKHTVPKELYLGEEKRHHDDLAPVLDNLVKGFTEIVSAFQRLELLLQERLVRKGEGRSGDDRT